MAKKKKKKFQKSSFFLNGPALTPPPLLMTWPLVEDLFFAASLRRSKLFMYMDMENIYTHSRLFYANSVSSVCIIHNVT